MSETALSQRRSLVAILCIAARPKTLTAAAVPVIAGSSLAFFETTNHHWWITLCALFSALSIQIGTNFINDAIDFKRGADNSERLGPMRVTQNGLISPGKLTFFASVFFAVSVLLGIPLVIEGGVPILLIGVLSVLFGYGYTSGPFPLAYNGLGEIFVILFFGIIAVGGVYFLQTHTYSAHCALLGVQIGLLATLIICINNLRDIEGDRAANKKTLAVRFGEKFARFEIAVTALTPFVLLAVWVQQYSPLFLLPLLALPLAIKIAWDLQTHAPGRRFNSYLARAAKVHALFGLLISGILICH